MPSEPKDPGSPRRASPRRTAKPSADLGQLIRAGHFTGEFKPRESSTEQESRLRREEAGASHDLWKEKWILVATLLGVGCVVLFCFHVLLRPEPSEDKKWAMSILAAIISGGVEHLRSRARKPD